MGLKVSALPVGSIDGWFSVVAKLMFPESSGSVVIWSKLELLVTQRLHRCQKQVIGASPCGTRETLEMSLGRVQDSETYSSGLQTSGLCSRMPKTLEVDSSVLSQTVFLVFKYTVPDGALMCSSSEWPAESPQGRAATRPARASRNQPA